jgi:hypothetical protein
MVDPITPSGSQSHLTGNQSKSDVVPPGPPLPANNPWVKNLATLFPDAPVAELQKYAAKFQSNMFRQPNSARS